MAFVQSAIPEEQQNQFGSGAPTTPNPLSLLPPQTGGAASGGGPTTPAASGVGSPTQFGTSASKLSDYLSANADQIQNQGNALAGQLTDQYGKTMGDVNSAVQGFGAQVQGGYTPANQATIDSFSANPTKFASDPGNVKNFQSLYGDTYSGPQNFETTPGYANVQNEVSKAVENAGQFNSPSGLSTYLTNTATGTYTPGMATLDSVLLAGNPNASAKVTAAAKPFAGLNDYLAGQTTQADTAVPAAQQAANSARTSAQTAAQDAQQKQQDAITNSLKNLQGSVNSYNTNLGTGKTTAESDIGNLVNSFNSLVGKNPFATYTPGRSASLGPVPSTGFFGEPGNPGLPSAAINALPAMGAPTLANAVSQEDLDAITALQTLTGDSSWNPAGGVTAPQPLTVPGSGNPYSGQEKDFANALYNYLQNVSFGQPTNQPLGNDSSLYGWIPATTGKSGENTGGGNFAPVANPGLQALLAQIAQLQGS